MKQSLTLRSLGISFENLGEDGKSRGSKHPAPAQTVEKNTKKVYNVEEDQTFENILNSDQIFEYLSESRLGSFSYEDGL